METEIKRLNPKKATTFKNIPPKILKGELTRQNYFLLSGVVFSMDYESVTFLEKFHFVLALQRFLVVKFEVE